MVPNPAMIRPDMLARLLPAEAVAPVAPVPDPVRNAPEFVQGQKYQAKVEARLPNGNFKVLIAGQALQMNLPESARPGDTMELALIAREPRLRFMLLGDMRASASDSASLSATGRFVGALAQDAAKALAPLLSNAAATLGPPADSRQLPGLLQRALAESGLFYESHQAQWVAGKRTLGQLLREPQGRLSAAASTQLDRVTELLRFNIESEPEAAVAGAVRYVDAPVHEQTLSLIQQQLSVLETGQLSWRGELWPGQWLEWDVAEHLPADGATAEPVRWQTRVRLTLPRLGEVVATLALDVRGAHVALDAAVAETADLLLVSREHFAAAMATAGLSVLGVEVHHDAGK